MKFLFFSPHGDAAGLAHRIQEEGNACWLYVPEAQARETLAGIVPHVKTLGEGLAHQPDVVFFDMVGYGEVGARVRKMGHHVIGSGSLFNGRSFQDSIELDRDFGMSIMKLGEIATPKTTKFKGSEIDKAIDLVTTQKRRYVCKPHGNKNPYLTHVADTKDSMAGHLEYMKAHKLCGPSEEFLLQHFVEGIELSTEMWFSNGKPVFPANGTMETKRLLHGDMGPNTGCQTSTVWCYDKAEPRIVQKTFTKLYVLLEKMEYTGPLDINCIITQKEKIPYGIEWTARPGYSAIYALARLLNGDLAKTLHGIAAGTLKEFDVKKGFGYSVRVTIPPYPLAIPDDDMRTEIFKETAGHRIEYSGDQEAFFPLDVRKSKDDNDDFESAGVDCVIGEITGCGDTVEQAKNSAHSNLKALHVANKQARLDGWKRPTRELPVLKSWGFPEMPDPAGTTPKGEQNVNKLSHVA